MRVPSLPARSARRTLPRARRLAGASLAALLAPAVLLAQPASPSPTAWREGATCYEVFVRSFADSDGDGIGDLRGLTQRLDYINDGKPDSRQSLGARCIWLMPVAESPSYHGYDVSNYYKVEPDYGTSEDFKRLIAAAHERGIRVLVDMVLNHASSEHPYFKAALQDTASPYRSWFRFSKEPGGKGPWGQDPWHKSPVRDEFYYGVFWSGMPDLNYETPAVREEALKVARFWLDSMGVDGFRLDAVPYLVEEGNQLAGAPGTHRVLHEFGDFVRQHRPASYTVGEVWDSVGVMLPYYPDQLDSYFAFEAADAILNAVRGGSAAKLYAPFLRLQQTVPGDRYSPFLRNHDGTRTMTELTKGDSTITPARARDRARLASAILLTMPGLPFVYYGEEIGMTGDKPDERLRTPMQWAPAATAAFTRGRPWEALQPDTLTANVASQERDPNSLLNLHRRLIHLRAANGALARGELVPLAASADGAAAYLRRDGTRAVLVVANLGSAPLSGLALTAESSGLAPGRYVPRDLLAGSAAAPLHVDANGRIAGYVPQATLAPLEFRVLELRPAVGKE